MNKSKFLLAVVLSALSFAASATKCADGLDISAHPDGNCNWYYQGTDPTASKGTGSKASAGAVAGSAVDVNTAVVVDARGAPVSNEQRQQQQQRQRQGQAQGQTSENNNQNVNNINTGSSGDSSYRATYTSWALPSLSVQAATVPSAFMMPIVRRCDARVHKISEPVYGTAFGPAGGQSDVLLGRRDDIQPVFYNWDGTIGEPFEIVDIWGTDPDGRRAVIGQQMRGHEVIGNAAVISASTSRGINIFGVHETTGGGLGLAGSGAMQQMTQQLNVFPCVYRERYAVWVKVEQKFYRPAIYVPRKPRVYVKPKPRPCIPAQNICPVVPGTSNGLQLPK